MSLLLKKNNRNNCSHLRSLFIKYNIKAIMKSVSRRHTRRVFVIKDKMMHKSSCRLSWFLLHVQTFYGIGLKSLKVLTVIIREKADPVVIRNLTCSNRIIIVITLAVTVRHILSFWQRIPHENLHIGHHLVNVSPHRFINRLYHPGEALNPISTSYYLSRVNLIACIHTIILLMIYTLWHYSSTQSFKAVSNLMYGLT